MAKGFEIRLLNGVEFLKGFSGLPACKIFPGPDNCESRNKIGSRKNFFHKIKYAAKGPFPSAKKDETLEMAVEKLALI